MAKLVWDVASERLYENGVKNGVLYYNVGDDKPSNPEDVYKNGVVWNGLISVTESPSGAESTPLYADDMKYLNLVSPEEFGATIEAYTYPKEFAACNGESEYITGVTIGQQTRKTFGLCYRTSIGNAENDALGYKLHLVYGCLAAPSEKAYSSVNDSPEATTFSWEISTTPVTIPGFKPTAMVVIDSTKVDPAKMKKLEDYLYGTGTTNPKMPSIAYIATLMA